MWILPKNHQLYSAFVQESEGLKEELNAQLDNPSGSPLFRKSKPLSSKTFWLAWKRVYWIQHLYGRILKPSLGQLFEEKLTELLEDTPASLLVLPEIGGGADDPRHLWPYIKQGIEIIKPEFCFFENVGGHLTLGYETVRRELQEMGYRVEEGIFSAEEVGAPHKRERLFILARLAYTCNNNRGLPEPTKRYKNTEASGSSQGMANTTSQRLQKSRPARKREFPKEIREGIHDRFKFSGNELGNTYSPTEYEIQARRPEFIIPGKQLANAAGERLQRQWSECRLSENSEEGKTYRSGNDELADPNIWREQSREYARMGRQQKQISWPARPGELQFEFEPSRTIKSGVGCTFNGYNFREDLLRALGNGVVEQTAELAFKTLLAKHYEHNPTIQRLY